MKVAIIGDEKRLNRYLPKMDIVENVTYTLFPLGTPDDELIKEAGDCEVLIADAIAPVSRYLIEHLDNLKMIHSEGVAFSAFDIEAARERGVDVCNCKAANAGAVAEQTILLMLGLLRDVIKGHEADMSGHQIDMKLKKMAEGVLELSDCKVGLVGFGDIAKETAKRLSVFGCEVYYYNRTRRSDEEEKRYNVTYLSLDELASTCDIVSIHVAVADETRGLVDQAFLSKMKNTAFLVNTARGEIIDNDALCKALNENQIAGAGLDTIAPEPTPGDHPLFHLRKDSKATILFAPHLGGNTMSSFKRAYEMIWTNVDHIYHGETPERIVNK